MLKGGHKSTAFTSLRNKKGKLVFSLKGTPPYIKKDNRFVQFNFSSKGSLPPLRGMLCSSPGEMARRAHNPDKKRVGEHFLSQGLGTFKVEDTAPDFLSEKLDFPQF